jgi:hypothetical protein
MFGVAIQGAQAGRLPFLRSLFDIGGKLRACLCPYNQTGWGLDVGPMIIFEIALIRIIALRANINYRLCSAQQFPRFS